MDFEIRVATQADSSGMHDVLTAAGLSTLEILESGSIYWVALEGSTTLGTCGLEIDGVSGLIRSVAVADAKRRCGIGRALLETAIAFARSRAMRQLFLFSKDTGAYFLALGWAEVAVESAAIALQDAPQVKRYQRDGWYPNERAFIRPL